MCYQSKLFTGNNEAIFHEARRLLTQLERAGHEAYIVGGAVRDALLKRQVNDLDIATSASPEQVRTLFSRTVATGLKHGTVTVITPHWTFEVTTFRREGPYNDARRPDYVHFVTDLTTDLARRDFTINAIACNRNEEIIDPFDGRADLQNRRIRSVGRAEERFQEDSLRILRALRFAAELSFDIEPRTLYAMTATKKVLRRLSIERVTRELDRLLSAPRPGEALQLLWRQQLVYELKPLLSLSQQSFLPVEAQFNRLNTEQDVGLRWILFLKMAGVPTEDARATFRAFKMPRKVVNELSHIWHEAARWSTPFFSVKQAREVVFYSGLKQLLKTIRLAYYFGHITREDLSRLSKQFCYADWHLPIDEASQLAIGGNDVLQQSGQVAGPWVGNVLQTMLLKVVVGEVTNNKADLLKEWRTHGPDVP